MTTLDVTRLAHALHNMREGCFGGYIERDTTGKILHDCNCGDHWEGECINNPHPKHAARLAAEYDRLAVPA